ncbi:hypothetical protein Tco_1481977 [Tanacetum coccineum]
MITNNDLSFPLDCELSDSSVIEEEADKEWEHTLLQDSMSKELHELNKCLEQKESEMRHFKGCDTMTLKQHFGKQIIELKDENGPCGCEQLAKAQNANSLEMVWYGKMYGDGGPTWVVIQTLQPGGTSELPPKP